MVRRLVLAAAVALVSATPALAQLDPEAKQPYHWRVVLTAKPHPLVTTDFRERVKRDVVAALQTGIGPLGTVEVIDLAELPRDRWDPLWQQFDDKGFAALDAPRDLTGAKTHFLRIDYRDGQFHIETRQYDGFTGLSSPLVRTRAVRAADQVGRAAGLLLDRDFGLTGTVEPVAGKADLVKVSIRGSALGPVNNHVQAGDVFALAAVRKTNRPAPAPIRTATGKIIAAPSSTEPPGLTSTPRPYALLKVTDVAPDGLRCTVLYADPAKAMPLAGGVIGYRCMKLGTVKGPVAVRLVGSDGSVERTASRVAVRASDTAFPDLSKPDPKDTCSFNAPTAQFRTGRQLSNVACVTVTQGATSKLFAVPVMSEDPITLPFEVDPVKAEKADYDRAVLTVASAAADARLAQTVCFEAVARLIGAQKNADALARAKGGRDAADAAFQSLTDELARLYEQRDKSPTAGPLLDKTKQTLDTLKQYNEQLKAHITKIEKVIEREKNPGVAAEADRLNGQIEVLLSSGEVDQALAAYAQLIALLPNEPEYKARRDKLAAEWKVKDDAHQKARDYLSKTWPALGTIPDYHNSLQPLRDAVAVCKRHGDKWAMRKLLVAFTPAGVKLNELVAALDPANEADKKLLVDAQAAGKALAELEKDLHEFIK